MDNYLDITQQPQITGARVRGCRGLKNDKDKYMCSECARARARSFSLT
jgi:hypothetical protein